MRKIFNEKDEGTLKPEKKRKKDEDFEAPSDWEEQELEEDDVDVDLLSEDQEFMEG